MIKNQFGVLLVFALCLAAAPAQGAEVKLAEFTLQNKGFFSFDVQPPETLIWSLEINDRDFPVPPESVTWQDEYGPADVGMSFFAPADFVSDAAEFLSLPTLLTANVFISNGGDPGSIFDVPQFLIDMPVCEPEQSSCLGGTAFVPSLADYRITAVERLVEQLRFFVLEPEMPPLQWDVRQTIRLWGVPIPEPATITLVLIGGVHLLRSRQRCVVL